MRYRLMIVIGALLMFVSGGLIAGGKILIARATGGIDNQNLLGDAGTGGRSSLKGPLNVLLVGIDQRPDEPDDPVRSDSIIVLHVPASHDQAYLVSLPRDLLVDIPAFRGSRAQRNKINAAFAFGASGRGGRAGGFKLLALTVKKLTGLEFDAGAIVDFGGFQSLVGRLGGVDMCIDQRVVSHHIGKDKHGRYRKPFTGPDGETRDYASTPEVYEPGCRHLAPWQALDYVRQRKGLANGDYDRIRHQQQFLKAVLRAAKKKGVTSNPIKAVEMMNAAGKAFTVDTHGVGIETWMYSLRNVTDRELMLLKTNGGRLNTLRDPVLGSCEILSRESRLLFAAMRTGTVAQFVAQHPDFANG